jgi:AraC-like DNA-binding protein
LNLFFVRHADSATHTGPPFQYEPPVRRAIKYLSEHRDRNVALAELAAAAGLDEFLLTRPFTRAVGMPPHAYHMQQRLRAAQARLAVGA